MPIDGAVSIEFRGDLIFIGVGSLFLGLVLIRRKRVGLKRSGEELGASTRSPGAQLLHYEKTTAGVSC